MTKPPRPRRRIAGETSPAEQQARPAKKVAKKPVRRPGAKSAQPAPAAKTETAGSRITPPPAKSGLGTSKPAPKKPAAQPAVKKSAPAKVDRPKAGSKETGSRPVWFVPAAVVAFALLIAGIVLTINGVRDYTTIKDRVQREDRATTAAQKAVSELLTFRFDQLDDYKQRVTGHLAPNGTKFFDDFYSTLEAIAKENQVASEAEVVSLAPTECGQRCESDEVDVLVFVNQANQAAGSKEIVNRRHRMVVSMKFVDKQWKINDVKNL